LASETSVNAVRFESLKYMEKKLIRFELRKGGRGVRTRRREEAQKGHLPKSSCWSTPHGKSAVVEKCR